MSNPDRPHIRVEFDPEFRGGDYAKVGAFALISLEDVDRAGSVEAAFSAQKGLPAECIIHFTVDELFDAEGEEYQASEPGSSFGPSI